MTSRPVELSQEEYGALCMARDRRLLVALFDWIEFGPDHHKWRPFVDTCVMAIVGHGAAGHVIASPDSCDNPIVRELLRQIERKTKDKQEESS